MTAQAQISRTDAASASPLFVINLCASTSPMALSHPSSPELKRYTFFVSRQREEGRERFRLHMGYFATQEEAETLLEAVRDVYPAAWAGPAPTSGAGRRGRVTAAAPLAPVMVAVPPRLVEDSAVLPQLPQAQALPQLVPVQTQAPAPAKAQDFPPPAAPVTEKRAAVLESMSNVHDVLAELSDKPEVAAAPPVAPAKDMDDVQALRLLETPSPAAAKMPAPVVVSAAVPTPAPALSLAPAPVAAPRRAAPPMELDDESDVPLVTPEDTQTLTDIRLDAQNNAPPCFAVQLVWSVSPIDVSSLPHLAIFDAYTLYNVEGNRQGRKWYGLRLGFFSDPNSATQVANYVRSDYRAVAVVPVASKERDRARGTVSDAAAAPRLGEATAPQKPATKLSIDRESLEGFELLADDLPSPAKRDLDDVPARAANAPAKVAAAVPPTVPVASPRRALPPGAPRATGKPSGKRVVVRKRPEPPKGRAAPGAPTPLESTLEILGASTLTLDEGREIINDSAIRVPLPKKSGSGSRFSKLLSRLSGG